MSTSKKGNAPKSGAKAAKAEKASFDKVISELEKENEAFVTPKSHKILFSVASIIASVSPLVIFWGGGSLANSKYWSAIIEGRVHENIIWYLVCVVFSAVVLVHTYNVQATRTRRKLLLTREAASSNERAETDLKSVTANESAYYTLFVLNSLYLVVFLLSLRYVLPAQELSERVNFVLASSGAAAVTAFAVALKMV
eukprot:gene18344-20887_t